MLAYKNGMDFLANTGWITFFITCNILCSEPDRNEFLILPEPISTDLLELYPKAGFGRRALNFQLEVLGNAISIGEPMGLADGRIANDQIFVSTAANDKQYPRLNRTSWDFQVNDHNEIVSVRFVFATRVLIARVFKQAKDVINHEFELT